MDVPLWECRLQYHSPATVIVQASDEDGAKAAYLRAIGAVSTVQKIIVVRVTEDATPKPSTPLGEMTANIEASIDADGTVTATVSGLTTEPVTVVVPPAAAEPETLAAKSEAVVSPVETAVPSSPPVVLEPDPIPAVAETKPAEPETPPATPQVSPSTPASKPAWQTLRKKPTK